MKDIDVPVIKESEIEEPQTEEPVVLGQKKWVDTIQLQLVSASYEVLKTRGEAPPDVIAGMTVRELLEMITPNKLRLKLERV